MKIEELKLYQYIIDNIDMVFKQPRAFIKHPFIDPGSVYDGNVWDWDTYWSVYGLISFSKTYQNEAFTQKLITHSKGNIYNFLDHQLDDGYIPMMIEVGQWDEPYLNKKHKEGVMMNMHKPFLCQQILLISDFIKDYTWIKDHVEALLRYFECYDRNYFFERQGLYVWCDDIMIGMDNDPATFGRPKFSTANIFLNSFMVSELEAMAKILSRCGYDDAMQKKFYDKKEALVKAIQRECWDERDGFYYSVDVDIKTRPFEWIHQGLGVFWKSLPIKIRVWSGFLPLLVGIATDTQASRLLKHATDPVTFMSPYGITSLAKDEKMFDLSVTNNPSNWLGPIWLVVNYTVFKGLLDYNFIDDAVELCEKTVDLLEKDLNETNSLHEYYNPFNGRPVMNGGFVNWNILALNMIEDLKNRGIEFR